MKARLVFVLAINQLGFPAFATYSPILLRNRCTYINIGIFCCVIQACTASRIFNINVSFFSLVRPHIAHVSGDCIRLAILDNFNCSFYFCRKYLTFGLVNDTLRIRLSIPCLLFCSPTNLLQYTNLNGWQIAIYRSIVNEVMVKTVAFVDVSDNSPCNIHIFWVNG